MNKGLTVPKQLEYVVVKPRQGRPALKAVAGLLIIGIAIGGGVLVWKHIQGPHTYPVLPLPALGLNASLKTKWVNNSAQYVFQVRPSSSNEARFDTVLRTVPREQLHFEIHLLDPDGFEVCSGSPAMHTTVGEDGKYASIRTDQVLANCSKEQLQTASKWHVSYRFPLLNANISPQPIQPLGVANAIPQSQLTGTDFTTGEIETLDKGSFHVLRKAEYQTLLGWSAT
jgi:hypothetical protein